MDIETMLAEAEIAKMLTVYAWALDNKDIETSMGLFAEDVRFDYSELSYPAISGKSAVREFFLKQVHTSDEAAFSSLTNKRIDVKGDTATGGDYFMHYSYKDLGSSNPKRTYVEGQHFYEFVKTEGAWKIRSMRVHITWQAG